LRGIAINERDAYDAGRFMHMFADHDFVAVDWSWTIESYFVSARDMQPHRLIDAARKFKTIRPDV